MALNSYNYDMRGPEVDFFHNPFPSSIVGIPGHDIENVVLENIEINYPGRASEGMAYVPLTRLEQVPEQEKNYPEFSMFGELPAWGFPKDVRYSKYDPAAGKCIRKNNRSPAGWASLQ